MVGFLLALGSATAPVVRGDLATEIQSCLLTLAFGQQAETTELRATVTAQQSAITEPERRVKALDRAAGSTDRRHGMPGSKTSPRTKPKAEKETPKSHRLRRS